MTRFVLLLALFGWWSPLVGQTHADSLTDSTLIVATRLVTEGRGDSARALVRGRLASLAASDSLYPEALYVAGVVAQSADTALYYFRRVSIDYSESSWADQALLRIAQLAFASGDYMTADQSAGRILSDYPFSDVRADAAYWLARVRLQEDSLAPACALLREASANAGDDVELANRAQFYLQRCPPAGTRPEATSQSDSGAKPASGPVVYSVQVAAVRSAVAADQQMRDLRAAGYDPRVVRDPDGFLKVRVGRFSSRAAAQRLQAEIRRKLGGKPFVVEEQ